MAIDFKKLKNYLKFKNVTPQIYSELISTNLTAKELGLKGEAEGTLIVAEKQTGGRGRLGRSFYSEVGGAYFSLLLYPTLPPKDLTLLTAMAAVAVAEAVNELSGNTAKIKWVNDILVENKKVAGILTETVFSGDRPITVIGIGVNLYPTKEGFPKDIENIAGTVFNENKSVTEKFIAEVINRFYEIYNPLPDINFTEKYRELSMLIGKEITYCKNNTPQFGRVLDIDNRCRLVVALKNDNTEVLSSGEVTLGSKNFTN